MERKLTSAEALAAFQVPGHCNWYTIGYGESRVTLRTQQVRALNLAWALKHEHKVSDGPIVVVGGGAAGLSVAAGLAHFGAVVTVLEKERFALPLQRHCYKRHIHPHVFDWPEPHSENAFADLPLLNWKAGMAREVATSIDAAFQELTFVHSPRLSLNVEAKDIELDAPRKGAISFRVGKRLQCTEYATLVFALGFGVENHFWTGRRGSYWSDDSLDQHGVFPAGRYLISGTGDGALIDLLRIATDGFRQEDLARLANRGDNIDLLRRALAEIESAAEAADPNHAGKVLFEGYRLLNPGLVRSIDEHLAEKLTSGVHVTILAQGASPFSLKSRPLHRLLLSRLLFAQADMVTARTNLSLIEGMLRRDGHGALFTHGDEQRFDHVVVRHGAAGAISAFPTLAASLKDFRPGPIGTGPLYETKEFGRGSGGGGPIAWAGGPDEEDYFDTLRSKASSVPGISGAPTPVEAFRGVHYEVRDNPQRPRARARPTAIQTEAQTGPGDSEDVQKSEEKKWREEVEQLHIERYWQRMSGMALQPSDYEAAGVTFLSGRPGTGKTTFLKLLAGRLLETRRRTATTRFPVWVSGALESIELDAGRVPEALADAAVRTLELAGYSRAASATLAQLRRGNAIVLLDAVDSWRAEWIQTVVQWLLKNRVPAVLAARRFPLDERARGSFRGVTELELLGISPRSTRAFIEAHVHEAEVTDRSMAALKGVPNAREWATTPFLLSLLARVVRRDGRLDEGGSILRLFERFVEIARSDMPDEIPQEERIRTIQRVSQIARRDLCANPPKLFFARERIPFLERERILATGLLTGDRLLEFSHLSIGEYFASIEPIDLEKQRGVLSEVGGENGWGHQLEILAMAHASATSRLVDAFAAANTFDPTHLRLVLLFRAIAYGTDAARLFLEQSGKALLAETARRLSPASGRFGAQERVLMRAVGRAAPLMKSLVSHIPPGLPTHGEPGAEAWSLLASMGAPHNARPRSSHWWPTVFHQARALLDVAPEDLWEATRGGEPMEREDAHAALGAGGEKRDLLSLRGDLRLVGALRAEHPSKTALHLGLLAHDEETARRWAINMQPPGFWAEDGLESVLTSIAKFDPSPSVRAAALEHLAPGLIVENLIEQLRHIARRRSSVNSGDVELLDRLLERLADEPQAKEFINTFLEGGDGWYVSAGAWTVLAKDEVRAAILLGRLESAVPHFHEIEAARDKEWCVAPVRRLVERLFGESAQHFRLASAIRALPKNDGPSREIRRACLHPEIRPDTEDMGRRISAIRSAAILSFDGDPDAFVLLQEFLGQTEDSEAADAAIGVIGRMPEARPLVWRQLREGDHNPAIDAIDILGEDPNEIAPLREFLATMPNRRLPFDTHRARIVKVLARSEGPDWAKKYLSEPSEGVRLEAIRALKDVESAEERLRELVFSERGQARRELWEKFAGDPEVRKELEIRAREDQWEVRRAYFSLSSDDDTKIDRLRSFLSFAMDDPKRAGALPELLQALARDDAALPLLRNLIDHPNMRVVATLLRVLKHDRELRIRARALLAESRAWVLSFFFVAESSFRQYFEGDTVAQETIFRHANSESGRRPAALSVVVPVLRGYTPAHDYLLGLLNDDDPNVAAAARSALLDDPNVREQLLRELEDPDKLVRSRAARVLAEVDDAQEALARHTSDPEKEIRQIACEALERLDRPIPDTARILQEEPEAEIRQAAVENLIRHTGEEAMALLRARVARDRDGFVRERAATALRAADQGNALRSSEHIRRAIDAAGDPASNFGRFLREPLENGMTTDPDLIELAIAWTVAKLVSSLPEPAPFSSAALFVDPWLAILGEMSDDDWGAPVIRLRIAADSSNLPRDRNIWPSANTILAWKAVCRLRSARPRAIVLACADVAFTELDYPAPASGEVCIGRHFRVRASHDGGLIWLLVWRRGMTPPALGASNAERWAVVPRRPLSVTPAISGGSRDRTKPRTIWERADDDGTPRGLGSW